MKRILFSGFMMIAGAIGIVGLEIASALNQFEYSVETIVFYMMLLTGIILGIAEAAKHDKNHE
jgi:hypothetical protein